MKKIQRQDAASTSQPPRIGPKIGPSSIGTPITAITRPTRCGPAARVRIVMPSGISMPPPKPWRTRKEISEPADQASPESTEPLTKRRDRGHVEALGAEAVGGPAGERDHGRQRERVAGRHPLDRRQRGLELTGERVDRHVDDGDVEDRHDRAEHDDPGDPHQRLVELVAVGGGEWRRVRRPSNLRLGRSSASCRSVVLSPRARARASRRTASASPARSPVRACVPGWATTSRPARGRRHAERVALALDDEHRDRDGVELVEPRLLRLPGGWTGKARQSTPAA